MAYILKHSLMHIKKKGNIVKNIIYLYLYLYIFINVIIRTKTNIHCSDVAKSQYRF